ncbi:DUF3325 domain-containing protein [Allohahella marinimesophila]|uniref:DUF3325 domain-containing protein n=1 Tax=Allohahella marinimesophila TaxID=1054972 RepID=A0ABP7PZ99_9GAMM
MSESLYLLAAFISAFTGMAWLALAMPVHWHQVHEQGKTRPATSAMRGTGSVMLILAGVFCLLADHASMAVLVWFMLLTLSAVLVAWLLARRPALFRLFCFGRFSVASDT